MSDKSSTGMLRVARDKRVLNEFKGKILNEEHMDRVVEARKGDRHSAHSTMLFSCECDDLNCSESISMSAEEYRAVHRKTRYFIVIPSHVHLDLEEIVTTFDNYVLVGKLFPRPPD
jgi:hypothetical protein